MAKSTYQIIVELNGAKEAEASLKTLGTAAGLSGAALLALSGVAAKASNDYEFALAKVGTVSSDVSKNTKQYEEAVTSLTNTLGNTLSRTEAVSASYDIASAGYTKQADLLAVLDGSQKTAIAGFSDLNTVGNAVTSTMNAFGASLGATATVQEKVNRVTNEMLVTQNLGKIVVAEYATQVGRVASTAAATGVSLEELNAYIATATSNGVSAEQAFTSFSAILSNVQKPTAEAKKEAQRLGIEFDATALKTKGFGGILNELSTNTKTSDDTLSTLFGSIEAIKGVAATSGVNIQKFNSNLQAMKDQAGAAGDAVDKAYTTMAGTRAVKAQAALKTLNDALVSLGQGVVIAMEPVLKALKFLADGFNALPDPIKQTTGFLVALTGGALTLAGAIVVVSGSIGVLTGALSTVLGIGTAILPVFGGASAALATQELLVASNSGAWLAYAASLGTAETATGGAAIATGALNLALLPVLATVGLVAAAVGALTLAWEHYNNIEIERKNEAISQDLKDTQSLTDATMRLVEQMKKSGKALPEAQYQALRAALKAAATETNGLSNFLRILDTDQAKAAAGTLVTSEAFKELSGGTTAAASAAGDFTLASNGAWVSTKQSTEATKAAKDATDKAKAAQEAHTKAVQDFIDKADKQVTAVTSMANAQIAYAKARQVGGASEAETTQTISALQDTLYRKTEGLRQKELQNTQLSANQRATIEESLAQTILAHTQALYEAKWKLQDLSLKRLQDSLSSEKSLVEANADTTLAILEDEHSRGLTSELEYRAKVFNASKSRDEATEALQQKQTDAFVANIDEKLKYTKAGSAEEAALVLKANEEIAKNDKARNADFRDLVKQRSEYLKAKLKEEEDDTKSSYQKRTETARLASEAQKNFQDALSGSQTFLDGTVSLYEKISKSLQDQNTSQTTRNTLLGVSKQLTADLAGLGIGITGNLNTELGLEQVLAQLAKAKFAIQIAILEAKKDELALTYQIQESDLQGQKALNEVKLQDATLSESDRRQAELQIQLADRKLGLLRDQLAVNTRNLDLQEKLARVENTVTTALNSEASKKRVAATGAATSSSSAPVTFAAPSTGISLTTTGPDGTKTINNGAAQAAPKEATSDALQKSIETAATSTSTNTKDILATAKETKVSSQTLLGVSQAQLPKLNDVSNTTKSLVSLATTRNSLLGEIKGQVTGLRGDVSGLSNSISNLAAKAATPAPRPTSR